MTIQPVQFLYGTLVNWFPTRNYGFVRVDLGTDYFIHIGGFADHCSAPQGSRLKFRLATNPKTGKRMAVDAEIVASRLIAAQYSAKSEVL